VSRTDTLELTAAVFDVKPSADGRLRRIVLLG
jgi:hypothetical protein